MVPIEQKDWTEEDRASKLGQNHPLDSTKSTKNRKVGSVNQTSMREAARTGRAAQQMQMRYGKTTAIAPRFLRRRRVIRLPQPY